jgi:hypothetical protein
MTPPVSRDLYSDKVVYPRALGICWVIYGALRLLVALWLVGFSATATVMFGALLTRVPNPYTLMSAFHLLYLVAVIWSLAAGALGIIAGLAMLSEKALGRALGILAAFLSLSEIPVGLTLSAYTRIVLLRGDVARPYVATARAA